MYLFLYLILLSLTLGILNNRQKTSRYIRLGWFFNVLTFLYYGLPLIFVSLYPDYSIIHLNRAFDAHFLEYVSQVLLVGQFSFFMAELALTKTRNRYTQVTLQSINSKIILILLLIGYILFFYRWSSVGGFMNILALSRVEYINEAAETGLLSRYDIVFNIISLFIAINISLQKDYVTKHKIIVYLYLLFLLLTVLMGTRLVLLNYVIGMVCVIFYLNKDFLLRRKRKIGFSILFIGIFLIVYQTVRQDVTKYFATNQFQINYDNITFIPAEIFTGLLSEHSIQAIVGFEKEVSYINRLIPNSIGKTFGIPAYDTYAVEIANWSRYTSGNAVYTIPYLFDVYHGAADNLWLLFVLSFLIYFVFHKIMAHLERKNLLIFLSIYFLAYNVFRAEGPIWFSKIYLTIFLLIIVSVFLKFKNRKGVDSSQVSV